MWHVCLYGVAVGCRGKGGPFHVGFRSLALTTWVVCVWLVWYVGAAAEDVPGRSQLPHRAVQGAAVPRRRVQLRRSCHRRQGPPVHPGDPVRLLHRGHPKRLVQVFRVGDVLRAAHRQPAVVQGLHPHAAVHGVARGVRPARQRGHLVGDAGDAAAAGDVPVVAGVWCSDVGEAALWALCVHGHGFVFG